MSDQSHLTDQDLSRPRTLMEYLRLYFSGFAMGSADIVPGVSGGTMAFILGVYTTLIDAIKSFNVDVARRALRFDVKGVLESVPWRFLLALGVGILSAIVLLASLLHDLLETQPTFVFAFFAGLIIASILAIGLKVRWTLPALVALALAGAVAFVIVGFDSGEDSPVTVYMDALEQDEGVAAAETTLIEALQSAGYANAEADVAAFRQAIEDDGDVATLEDHFEEALYEPSSLPVLFVSGAIAICAMILPGISGSFILLILGQYAVVLGAVKTFDIVSIAAVGAGAAIGIVLFSRVISWLLNHHENVTVATLTGFMAGSLRLIWAEAQAGVEVVNESGTLSAEQWVLAGLLLLVGFLVVSFFDHLQSRANPVFAWFWKPGPPVDSVAKKAEAMD